MTAHLKAQLLRFARTSALTFVASLFMTGGHIGWSSLWAMLAGAGETGLREVLPVVPSPFVSSQPDRPTETTPPPPPATG